MALQGGEIFPLLASILLIINVNLCVVGLHSIMSQHSANREVALHIISNIQQAVESAVFYLKQRKRK